MVWGGRGTVSGGTNKGAVARRPPREKRKKQLPLSCSSNFCIRTRALFSPDSEQRWGFHTESRLPVSSIRPAICDRREVVRYARGDLKYGQRPMAFTFRRPARLWRFLDIASPVRKESADAHSAPRALSSHRIDGWRRSLGPGAAISGAIGYSYGGSPLAAAPAISPGSQEAMGPLPLLMDRGPDVCFVCG